MKTKSDIKVLIYIWFCLLFYSTSILALPILSELSVVGGERGVALVLTADSPFEAEFSVVDKNVVVILKKCIYGLSEFKYTNFPPTSPLISVSAVEKKSNSVEIIFSLKSMIKAPLKTVKKENRWLALISDSPTSSFKWSASEQLSYNEDSTLKRKEKLSVPPVTTDSIQKSVLKDVWFIQRANICELSFIFNRNIKAKLKKEKNIVTIRIDNTENETDKSIIKISGQQSFGDVYLKKEGNDLLLTIFLSLDISKKEQGVFLLNNNIISLLVKNPHKEKIVIWQNNHGIKTDYSFVDFPVYSIDLIAMGKRAKKDSNTKISKKQVFMVALSEDMTKEETVPKEEITPAVSPLPVEGKNLKDSLPASPKKAMRVIARSVNVRASPSINARVINKLKQGDLVYTMLEKDKWCKIEKDNLNGYVYTSFLKEEKTDSTTELTTISKVEEINSIRKVSAITEPAEKIISETTAVVFIKEETDTTKKSIANRIIRYNGKGRDPFIPILPSALSVDGMPFVENLVLVGILYDDNDRIALCEDKNNNSKPFSLRENDPIVKGKVLKIYKDKVVFLITEYGISRSYTLKLLEDSNLKEVSKK